MDMEVAIWKLRTSGVIYKATIRADRIKGCPLISEKDLKKQGRGSSCYMVDLNSGITALRWFDNKCIQIATTYADLTDMQTIQRWDRASKKHIEITCPSVIKQYNNSMGE